jgi:P-type Cu+ transporter
MAAAESLSPAPDPPHAAHDPVCGMALEPLVTAAPDTANPELRDMTRPFRAEVALSLPLLAPVMAGHFAKPALDALAAPRSAVWIQLILATPAVLWGRWLFFRRGWASLINRRLNMFT